MTQHQLATRYDTAHYERAGPTLLAQQIVSTGDATSDFKGRDWSILIAHCDQRLKGLYNWRISWWTHWAEIAEYILPRRSTFLTQSSGGQATPNNNTRGYGINGSIVDPTPTYALRVCSGGLMSGLASPSRQWFKNVPIVARDINADERAWLDNVESRMYTVLAQSNFYNAFAQEIEDLIAFGTAPVIMYEDKQDVIRLYNPCVGEYYLANSSTMRVDGLFREFVMTIAQIVDFFGIDACPRQVKAAWLQKGEALEREMAVCHAVEPNFPVGGSANAILPGKFVWREIFWLKGLTEEQPLSIRGFHDCPFTAARWATVSNDAYGRSPGMDVLPDCKQLMQMTRRMAEGIDKGVRPPLLADEQLKNRPSSQLPGHVTYVSGLGPHSGMRKIYDVDPNTAPMAALVAQIQERIRRGLFNDLFLMLETAPSKAMTAYEVAQKVQEKLQVLGPVIESLLNESLKPKLRRLYGIMQRRALIPPPPDSLKGQQLEIQFVSMLALAQRATATGGVERIVALVGNMVSVFPEVASILDAGATLREMNDLLGNPQKILRGPEQVAQNEAQKQQAQQQQQQAAAIAHGADVAKTGAQAANVLANTQIGGGANALAALLGAQGQNQAQ
jgi:hypothetical protein